MAIMWEGCIRFSAPRSIAKQRFGYFLQITDLHMDNEYMQGASEDSGCHQNPRSSQMLKVGRLGAPGLKCDSPVSLVEETLDWISQEWEGKLDFVIWTGDNVRHNWDRRNPRKLRHVMEHNQLATEMMADRFQGVPIIPTLGNNDVYPHNSVVEDDHLLEFYQKLWSAWLPADNIFHKGGYFVTDVSGGSIRVVSLNTIFFIKKNKAVGGCVNPGPARDQLIWLERTFHRARTDKVHVIIIGHVPPSPRDYRGSCFKAYIELAVEYSDVIVSHHYGHLNMDHFLLYSSESSSDLARNAFNTVNQEALGDGVTVSRNIQKYVGWLFDLYGSLNIDDDVLDRPPSQENMPLVAIQVAPSILPTYLPSIRVYKYALRDEANPSAALLGYTQYYANTTLWELNHPAEKLKYIIEYTTEEAYGLSDLFPASIFKFAKYMVEGGDTMRTKYIQNMFVRARNDSIPAFMY
ncbi:Metallo-dependent phosphatase-like protein [Dichotomocladium elegans]|nr:Metallo-dependent phosphatase-like protein [Dichotomocladium elegans]